jgi:arylsulfatase
MYGDGKWHLYNIKKDPAESTPLESEMPKRLEKMIAIFDSYAKEKGVIEVEDSWNPWYGSYVPEQSK